MPSKRSKTDAPSLRQRLHAATGDRHAEAEAVADRAHGTVSENAAEEAVRDAHGDTRPSHEAAVSESAQKDDLATASDARAVDEKDEERDP